MMLLFVSQLALLILLSLVLLSLSGNRVYQSVVAAVMSIWLILQLASVYVGGSLIDEKFWEHFNLSDIFKSLKFFAVEAILGFIVMVGLFLLFRWAGKKLAKKKWARPIYLLPVAALCLLGMTPEGGILRNLYALNQLQNVKVSSFQQSLEDLGVPVEEYVTPENLQAQAGKNIIVLSLESYEAGYLEDQFDYLTPTLRRLAREETYLPLFETKGSDYTSASLYTYFTGVPMFFKGERSRIFRNAKATRISHIGQILTKAGYHQRYLIGDSEFGGENHMLGLFGVPVYSRDDFDTTYQKPDWALHDRDLFIEIKKAVKEEADSGSPFAIFASTIATHGPNGVHDPKMVDLVGEQNSTMELAVRSTDYLIGDLIEYLEEENLLENTVFYIFPDHKLMGPTISISRKFAQPRGLYVITNAEDSSLTANPADTLYQIELPKLILEGAEVSHNARFLAEFIEGDKEEYILANRPKLLSLNEASLTTERFDEDLNIELTLTGNMLLTSGEATLEITELDPDGKKAIRIDFDKRMNPAVREGAAYALFVEDVKEMNLYLTRDGKTIYAMLRDGMNTVMYKTGVGSLQFTKGELMPKVPMSRFLQENVEKYPQEPWVRPLHQNAEVRITSTSYGEQFFQTPTLIMTGGKRHSFSRGVNLLRFQDGEYSVQSFDTYDNEEVALNLVETLEQLQQTKETFLVVVDATVGKTLLGFRDRLSAIGFDELGQLEELTAYIAYAETGWVTENSDKLTLSFSMPYVPIKPERSIDEIMDDSRDPMRFIAHAGGAVDGEVYTNTLEALDQNYAKGFRLFELDIVRTSDGEYVAAHDWFTWRRQSGYKGQPPVSRQEFLEMDILGTYTPLDMDRINDWFASHPDAILVTDKVNFPTEFASQFVDKSRLMMELFSQDAIEEALELGIREVIPSMNVITGLGSNRIQWLKDRGISYIAVSIDLLYRDPTFFEALNEAGIRTYLFHINSNPWEDEAHVVRYEMDRIYGLYADHWSFR